MKKRGTGYGRHVTELRFLNASSNVEIAAAEQVGHKVNCFIGQDPEDWKTDLPTSLAVLYKGIYPRVNLKVRGTGGRIEYDWVVEPGGNVGDIQILSLGADSCGLDEEGNLLIRTALGEIIHKKPVGFQMAPEGKRSIAVKFKQLYENAYGYEAAPYDPRYPLIIDPLVLVYSSYLGGSKHDMITDIALDSSGAVYVVGVTESSNFPVQNGYDSSFASETDVFVAKLSPDGKSLVFSTFLGGNQLDVGYGIALDGMGAIYIVGLTQTANFPRKRAFDGSFGGEFDGFVTKLEAAGNALIYSTYLGGRDIDAAESICVDGRGAAYVAGFTASTNFPTKNAYDSTLSGAGDAFLTKFSPSGNIVEFSTYLGGKGREYANDLALDSTGAIYVAGETRSSNFPRKNAFDGTKDGPLDGFLTKFAPSGRALVFSTYIGGEREDAVYGLAVDSSGSAYVVGYTYSTDFPVKDAYDSTLNSDWADAFLAQFNPAGNGLVFSTYYGGSKDDYASRVAVDDLGNIYSTGGTYSSNFPRKNGLPNAYRGDEDAFVVKFPAGGNPVSFSTFLGGNGRDSVRCLAVDFSGAIYVAGITESSNFPKKNAYDQSLSGRADAFITKIR
jgi:hypothetical protein